MCRLLATYQDSAMSRRPLMPMMMATLFCLKLVHPHTAELVPLNWDDTWRETLVAPSIPFNIGLLQLEVHLSQDYTFYPRLANPSGTGHLGKSVTVPRTLLPTAPSQGRRATHIGGMATSQDLLNLRGCISCICVSSEVTLLSFRISKPFIRHIVKGQGYKNFSVVRGCEHPSIFCSMPPQQTSWKRQHVYTREI